MPSVKSLIEFWSSREEGEEDDATPRADESPMSESRFRERVAFWGSLHAEEVMTAESTVQTLSQTSIAEAKEKMDANDIGRGGAIPCATRPQNDEHTIQSVAQASIAEANEQKSRKGVGRGRATPCAARGQNDEHTVQSVAQILAAEAKEERIIDNEQDKGSGIHTKEGKKISCSGIFHRIHKLADRKRQKKAQRAKLYTEKVTLLQPVSEAMRYVRPILDDVFKAKDFVQRSRCFDCILPHDGLHLHISFRPRTLKPGATRVAITVLNYQKEKKDVFEDFLETLLALHDFHSKIKKI